MSTNYRKPTAQYIGDGAQKLYNLETRRNEIIKACAKEQGNILGFSEAEFWTHSMPEALLSVLDSFDKRAALLAAQAYVERNTTLTAS